MAGRGGERMESPALLEQLLALLPQLSRLDPWRDYGGMQRPYLLLHSAHPGQRAAARATRHGGCSGESKITAEIYNGIWHEILVYSSIYCDF